jgi:lipopolysaccharide/colanic/teichoic acid biosynthesis glycosyltransferase
MHKDAEKDGPKWKIAGDYDPRFTFIGRILAKTHLDELPQLINILKREISFVGPRPERPEFVSILEEKIPYYNIRHLIKPGITGWAQINYKYGASIEDTYEKVQYDIYYLKNRSIILDLAIILKTLKSFFVSNK